MPSLSLKAAKSINEQLAATNLVYVSPEDAKTLTIVNQKRIYLNIKGYIFLAEANAGIKKGYIAFGNLQRQTTNVSLEEEVICSTLVVDKDTKVLSSITIIVDTLPKAKTDIKLESKDLQAKFLADFNEQFFTENQKLGMSFGRLNLSCVITEVSVFGKNLEPEKGQRGLIAKDTELIFVKAQGTPITIVGSLRARGPIKVDWDFERMGIGGLDAEFSNLFRRAFASRVFPPIVVQKLGINHVRGILLYGPPGTGKTLIARKIGEMLNCKAPKIVNGPEVLNKYVGETEKNIRELFKDAEIEQKERGAESDLHLIIFDEIDAICKQRGTTQGNAGVGDTLVNQLLAKIDGVEALNNILLVGMTNRKDLMDEALLRPGRLEVQIEIGLPDLQGRLQILKIHTAKMRENNFLAPDVDLEELAHRTKNYTGAEIEGLVKSAVSYSFDKQIDAKNPKKPVDPDKIKVGRDDFENAIKEVPPAFGAATNELELFVRGGLIDFGPNYQKLINAGRMFLRQVQNSEHSPLVSVLLEGSVGCGKSALAATLALESQFPLIKLLSAEEMVSYSEGMKCQKITKVFNDAYKSPLSVIVIDDVERIVEYVPIGPRFSNSILQTLLIHCKKMVKGRRMLILATTSNFNVLKNMDFLDSINAVLHVPNIQPGIEVKTVLKSTNAFTDTEVEKISKAVVEEIPLKKLLMIVDMAQQSTEKGNLGEKFLQCMEDYGIQHKSNISSLF